MAEIDTCEEFYDDKNVFKGLLIGLVISVIFSVLYYGSTAVNDTKKRNNLYTAMQEDDLVLDKKEHEVVYAIKRILQHSGEQESMSLENFAKNEWKYFQDNNVLNGWYIDILFSQYELLKNLVEKKQDYHELLEATKSTKEHFSIVLFVAVLLLELFASGAYACACWFAEHTMLSINLKNPGLALSVIIFSPALIIFAMFELAFRLFIFIGQAMVLLFYRIFTFVNRIRLKIRNQFLPKDLKDEIKKMNVRLESYRGKNNDQALLNYKNHLAKIEQNKTSAISKIANVRDSMEESKQLFVDVFSRVLVKMIKDKQYNVDNGYKNLGEIGKELAKNQKIYSANKAELKELKEQLADNKRYAIDEQLSQFCKCASIDGYLAVKIKKNSLLAYTDLIRIKKHGHVYEVGYIVVTINLFSNDIQIRNLSSTHPKGLDHPYSAGGSLCFGGTSGEIYFALRRRDYFTALVHIRKHLNSWEGDKPEAIEEYMEVIA